ncbi:hypothetical protein D210916BOD24_03290 [Alteromonas sp. D210916BOD_24]|uniref:molybdenum cofactor guanylyltransferase n=1 Tax=Alteromonas sp. D210916BOD_24 TaxID=3157618 RepID=UPI00399C9617
MKSTFITYDEPAEKGAELDDFCALILCGGQSRRMGKDKRNLKLGQRDFLQLAQDALCQLGVANTIFVGGKDEPMQKHKIADTYSFQGPAVALLHALRTLAGDSGFVHHAPSSVSPLNKTANPLFFERYRHCVIIPVDMPLLTPASILPLIEVACGEKHSCHYDNECFPLVIYNVAAHLDKLTHAISGQAPRSMRTIIQSVGALRVDVPVGLERTLVNINTPQDYAKYCT